MDKTSNNEFQLYLDAGRKLITQGDVKQAERILGYGLRMLEERINEESLLRLYFLSSLGELKEAARLNPELKSQLSTRIHEMHLAESYKMAGDALPKEM